MCLCKYTYVRVYICIYKLTPIPVDSIGGARFHLYVNLGMELAWRS